MNILDAYQHVLQTARAYLAQDAYGLPLIPQQAQRPMVLMGPPGIGKTAIVSQVARELGVNFVAYSITHHTRQSALGLPYIAELPQTPAEATPADKSIEQQVDALHGAARFRAERAEGSTISAAAPSSSAYRQTKFTMSEIVAATYEAQARSGEPRGILFLDEINCASETLMPAMLAFLQYKTFGQHRLPDGWIVVCAGNPPEYNRAARPFDPALWDRLARIDVEANTEVWLEYARSHGVHPAITSYLAAKPQNFYRVRPHATGTRIVTARGWEDLSYMLGALAKTGGTAGLELVRQYIQDADIAQDFEMYLELYYRYQEQYSPAEILAGTAPAELVARAAAAPFDERVAITTLLTEALLARVHESQLHEAALKSVRAALASYTQPAEQARFSAQVAQEQARAAQATLDELLHNGAPDEARTQQAAYTQQLWQRLAQATALAGTANTNSPTADKCSQGRSATTFEAAKAAFNEQARAVKVEVDAVLGELEQLFFFMDVAFGQAEEQVVCISRMSSDPEFANFLLAHPSQAYVNHAKLLQLETRGMELLDQAEALIGSGAGELG